MFLKSISYQLQDGSTPAQPFEYVDDFTLSVPGSGSFNILFIFNTSDLGVELTADNIQGNLTFLHPTTGLALSFTTSVNASNSELTASMLIDDEAFIGTHTIQLPSAILRRGGGVVSNGSSEITIERLLELFEYQLPDHNNIPLFWLYDGEHDGEMLVHVNPPSSYESLSLKFEQRVLSTDFETTQRIALNSFSGLKERFLKIFEEGKTSFKFVLIVDDVSHDISFNIFGFSWVTGGIDFVTHLHHVCSIRRGISLPYIAPGCDLVSFYDGSELFFESSNKEGFFELTKHAMFDVVLQKNGIDYNISVGCGLFPFPVVIQENPYEQKFELTSEYWEDFYSNQSALFNPQTSDSAAENEPAIRVDVDDSDNVVFSFYTDFTSVYCDNHEFSLNISDLIGRSLTNEVSAAIDSSGDFITFNRTASATPTKSDDHVFSYALYNNSDKLTFSDTPYILQVKSSLTLAPGFIIHTYCNLGMVFRVDALLGFVDLNADIINIEQEMAENTMITQLDNLQNTNFAVSIAQAINQWAIAVYFLYFSFKTARIEASKSFFLSFFSKNESYQVVEGIGYSYTFEDVGTKYLLVDHIVTAENNYQFYKGRYLATFHADSLRILGSEGEGAIPIQQVIDRLDGELVQVFFEVVQRTEGV